MSGQNGGSIESPETKQLFMERIATLGGNMGTLVPVAEVLPVTDRTQEGIGSEVDRRQMGEVGVIGSIDVQRADSTVSTNTETEKTAETKPLKGKLALGTVVLASTVSIAMFGPSSEQETDSEANKEGSPTPIERVVEGLLPTTDVALAAEAEQLSEASNEDQGLIAEGSKNKRFTPKDMKNVIYNRMTHEPERETDSVAKSILLNKAQFKRKGKVGVLKGVGDIVARITKMIDYATNGKIRFEKHEAHDFTVKGYDKITYKDSLNNKIASGVVEATGKNPERFGKAKSAKAIKKNGKWELGITKFVRSKAKGVGKSIKTVKQNVRGKIKSIRKYK